MNKLNPPTKQANAKQRTPVILCDMLFLAERPSIADPTERANFDEEVDGLIV
jgi:hypothetical protein